jgi:hypothetical protein
MRWCWEKSLPSTAWPCVCLHFPALHLSYHLQEAFLPSPSHGQLTPCPSADCLCVVVHVLEGRAYFSSDALSPGKCVGTNGYR